jgi:transposase
MILKKICEKLASIQKIVPGKRVEVWFQDEARVGQHGRLTRVWGDKGKRKAIAKDMRFSYTYIYGAVCPERDTGEAIVIDQVSKEAMENHLKIVSQAIPEDRHAVMIMDRAPWHKTLTVPENITIVHLPSYSPELNACENVWEYLKNNFLSNRVFNTLEDIIDACCNAWVKLTNEQGRITSIATRNWIQIN